MKKIIAVLLIISLVMVGFAGCFSEPQVPQITPTPTPTPTAIVTPSPEIVVPTPSPTPGLFLPDESSTRSIEYTEIGNLTGSGTYNVKNFSIDEVTVIENNNFSGKLVFKNIAGAYPLTVTLPKASLNFKGVVGASSLNLASAPNTVTFDGADLSSVSGGVTVFKGSVVATSGAKLPKITIDATNDTINKVDISNSKVKEIAILSGSGLVSSTLELKFTDTVVEKQLSIESVSSSMNTIVLGKSIIALLKTSTQNETNFNISGTSIVTMENNSTAAIAVSVVEKGTLNLINSSSNPDTKIVVGGNANTKIENGISGKISVEVEEKSAPTVSLDNKNATDNDSVSVNAGDSAASISITSATNFEVKLGEGSTANVATSGSGVATISGGNSTVVAKFPENYYIVGNSKDGDKIVILGNVFEFKSGSTEDGFIPNDKIISDLNIDTIKNHSESTTYIINVKPIVTAEMIESAVNYNDLVDSSKVSALESFKKAIDLVSIKKSQLAEAANAAVKLEKDNFWINNADTSWYVDKNGKEIDYLGEYYTASVASSSGHDVNKIWLRPSEKTIVDENGAIFKNGTQIGVVDPRLEAYVIDTPEKLAGLAKIVMAVNVNFSACTGDSHKTSNLKLDLSQYCHGINFFSKSNADEGSGYSIVIELGGDIDLSGKLWSPIGNINKPFIGSFDGNGHTISNLEIDEPDKSDLGLFGFIERNYQVIFKENYAKNVNFENVSIIGGQNIGALAGYFKAPSIDNINLKNIKIEQVTSTGKSAYAGGLVGKHIATSIKNVSMTGTNILRSEGENSRHMGGIFGYGGDAELTLSNISVDGLLLESQGNAGGIAGTTSFTTLFENCLVSNSEIRSTGVVSSVAYGNNVGGLFSFITTNTNGESIATLHNTQVINTKVFSVAANRAFNIADPTYYVAPAAIESAGVITYYDSLDKAVEGAKSGDVIKLYEDEYATTRVAINKSISIQGVGRDKTKIVSSLNNSSNEGVIYLNNGTTVLEGVTLKVADLSISGKAVVAISAENTQNCKLVVDNVGINMRRYGVHSRKNNELTVEILNSDILGYGAYYSRASKNENVAIKNSKLNGTAFYDGTSNSFAAISIQYGGDAGSSENVKIAIENSIISAGTVSNQKEYPFSIVGCGKGLENKNTSINIKNSTIIKDGVTLTAENYVAAFRVNDESEIEERSVVGLSIVIDGKNIQPIVFFAYEKITSDFMAIYNNAKEGDLSGYELSDLIFVGYYGKTKPAFHFVDGKLATFTGEFPTEFLHTIASSWFPTVTVSAKK